jgi:hypothetical protein
MIDALWHPAIIRSAYRHFYNGIKDNIGVYTYLPAAGNDERPKKTEWCEIRLNGPFINERGARCFKVELEVDILVESAIRQNIYYSAMLAGQVAELYVCFPVYLDNDEEDLLGYFDLVSAPDPRAGVSISQLGLIKDLKHERANVTAIFEMEFTR